MMATHVVHVVEFHEVLRFKVLHEQARHWQICNQSTTISQRSIASEERSERADHGSKSSKERAFLAAA